MSGRAAVDVSGVVVGRDEAADEVGLEGAAGETGTGDDELEKRTC
jgi:hypothetical protein